MSEPLDDDNEYTPVHDRFKDPLFDQIRIMCILLVRPETHESRTRHVQNTWGKRCNKLLVFTTKDGKANNTIGAIPLDAEQGRVWLWHKAKEAFKYVYENHIDEADWFFKADDDTYVGISML